MTEPMAVNGEEIDNPAATATFTANLRPTADDELLPLPNTGQQVLRWSEQILAQLRAVSDFDTHPVFHAEQTAPRRGEAPALHHRQPRVPRHDQVPVSSHNGAPRPRHDHILDAASSSVRLPMAVMSPTRVPRRALRTRNLLRSPKTRPLRNTAARIQFIRRPSPLQAVTNLEDVWEHEPVDAERRVVHLYRPNTSSAPSPTRPPFIEPSDLGEPSETLVPSDIGMFADVERTFDKGPHSLFCPSSLLIDRLEQQGRGLRRAVTLDHRRDQRQLRYDYSKKDIDLNPSTPVQGHIISSPSHSVNMDTHPTSDLLADGEEETSSVACNPPTSDHPALYEEETSTSDAPLTERMFLKEQLFQESIRWEHRKSVNHIKNLIHYDDDDRAPDLNPEDLSIQRRRYENYVYNRTSILPRRFHVYGTKRLYNLDRLRLWVRLGQNLNPRTPFPPGYKPIRDA